MSEPGAACSGEEIPSCFGDSDLVDPGLVTAPEWRCPVPRRVGRDGMWVPAGTARA